MSILSPIEVYYVTALLIEINQNESNYDSSQVGMSDLATILDPSTLMKICSVFGGQEIKIPTKSEFERFYLSSIIYLYTKVGMTPHEIKQRLPMEHSITAPQIQKLYNEVASKLVKFKIPDNINKDTF